MPDVLKVLRLVLAAMLSVVSVANAQTSNTVAHIPGVADSAIELGRDLDGDGDADEITIRLEVIEVTEEVYPGEYVKFWVFAPTGQGMTTVARVPSPTIRVEEGDRVRIILQNTHYFPHTDSSARYDPSE